MRLPNLTQALTLTQFQAFDPHREFQSCHGVPQMIKLSSPYEQPFTCKHLRRMYRQYMVVEGRQNY